MKDIQNLKDDRNIYLNEVGICDLKYPVEIKRQDGSWYPVPALVSLRADLSGSRKGTHMSRFVEILQENPRLDMQGIQKILKELKENLEADNSYVSVSFDWFIEKESPVSEKKSLLDVKVTLESKMIGDQFFYQTTVDTPVTTLCPCSKEISDYSAHNQRANIIIKVESDRFIWIEDLVRISEDAASSPLYSLLKRPDEKYVTEYAYDHPRFVEDVCRDVKLKLDEMKEIRSFTVEVISHESIHNHKAYAKVVCGRESCF